MNLHTVKSCEQSVCGRLPKVRDDDRNLLQLELARLRHFSEAVIDEGARLRTDGRGRHGRCAAGPQVNMGNAPHVPQLYEDAATPGVYRVCHVAPAIDLRLRVDPGGVLIALRVCRNLRGFGDHQTC